MVSDIKRDIPKFDTALLHSNWSNLRRKSNRHKHAARMLGMQRRNSRIFFSVLGPQFNMYARVPHAIAQFVLKQKNCPMHITGTALVLEMACAYGLRSRLWLLIWYNIFGWFTVINVLRVIPHSVQALASSVFQAFCPAP